MRDERGSRAPGKEKVEPSLNRNTSQKNSKEEGKQGPRGYAKVLHNSQIVTVC